MADIPATQIVRGMPFADYREARGLSSSGAKKLLRSPMHYRMEVDTPSKPTASMNFGTAVHAGILEPDWFRDRVAKAPECDRRTAAGKSLWAQFLLHSAGKTVLSMDDFDRAQACIYAVREHPAASRLLDGAESEVSLFWTDGRYKVPCKARLDALKGGIIVDVKTCQDASPDGFARAMATYLYDLQAAFYCSGCEHVLNASPEAFVFVAVESEPPHAVAVYELGAASILAGAHRADIAMERYAAAKASGQWPGYDPRINRIELPKWARTFQE